VPTRVSSLLRLKISGIAPAELHPYRQPDFAPRIAAVCERQCELCRLHGFVHGSSLASRLNSVGYILRASLQASVGISALAPLRRIKGAVVAISKIMSIQWRKIDGRWP
jgi:hypothetical protein